MTFGSHRSLRQNSYLSLLSLVTPAFARFPPIAENGAKAALTTGMTTDRKIFIFTPRRGIMAEIEYPGIAKLVSRLVWENTTSRIK